MKIQVETMDDSFQWIRIHRVGSAKIREAEIVDMEIGEDVSVFAFLPEEGQEIGQNIKLKNGFVLTTSPDFPKSYRLNWGEWNLVDIPSYLK